MASNRIGALYAEVILDPRGYSRGVSKVQSEQKILAAAIKDTTTPIERLQAEIDSIDSLFDKLAAKEPFEGQDLALDALINKTQLLADEIKRLEDLPAKQAEAENIKLAEAEHKEKLKREEELKRKQQETLNFMRAGQERRKAEEEKRAAEELKAIKDAEEAEKRRVEKMIKDFYYLEGVKAKSRKMEQDAIKEEERLKKKAKADAIAHEKRMQTLQSQRALSRLKEFQYIKKFGASQGLSAMFKDAGRAINDVNGGLSKMAGNLAQAAGFGPQIQGLARAFGAAGLRVLALVAALYTLGKALFSAAMAADKFDQTQIKIAAALGGNKIRARLLTEQMREFAAKTSYSTEQMQEFAARMLTLGVSANKIPDIAEKLGGLAMGDPERLKLIGKAYSDVMTKGRLQAQEANQFANANVPIYQALSDILGKSVQTVREMSERGEITASQVDEALQRIREITGADQAMAERSNTIAGQWDEIKSSAAEIWRILGGPMQDAMVRFLRIVNSVMKGIEYLAHAIEPFIEGIGKGWGFTHKMAILFGNIWMIITGQTAELERQAMLESEIEEANKERNRAELEALELAEKRAKTFDEMQQQLADELQGYYDRFNEEERLADIQLERLFKEKDITEEQKEQLRTQREFNKREKERLEAEKKAEEDAKKQEEEAEKKREKAKEEISDKLKSDLKTIDKQTKERQREAEAEAEKAKSKIEKNLKEKESDFDKAAGMAGTSFGAGSVAEYQFMRNLRMQDLKAAKQEQFEKKAAEERSKINVNLANLLKAISQDADLASNHAQLSFEGAMSNLP